MAEPTNPNRSQLDQQQIIQRVMDESTDRLRVDASVTASIGDLVINAEESDIAIKDRVTGNLLKINNDGSLDVNVNIDAASDSIRISDGTDTLSINSDGSINVAGVATAVKQDEQTVVLNNLLDELELKADLTETQPVSLASVPLATNAATETKQDSQLTVLNNLLSELELKANLTDTQPVSISTLPLASGAATEAKQDNIITVLNSIDSGTPSALGQATAANSVPVVLASNQSAIPGLSIGTEDGTVSGPQRVFVNNIKSQILASQDRDQDITYADFGTKNQRITQIDYSSATFSGVIARKLISYTLVGNLYRRDSINWTIV